MPSAASTSRIATCAASMACKALTMEKYPGGVPVLPLRRTPAAPQPLGDIAGGAGEAGAAVDDEDHRVGFRDRLLGLPRHLHRQALFGTRLEAAGIDGDEAPIAGPAFAVLPVARHARQVVHDG